MTDFKVTPDFKTFCRLTRQGNLIPIYTEYLADMETPVSAAMKLDQGENFFLLESVEGSEKWATYSFLGVDPRWVFSSKGQDVQLITEKSRKKMRVKGNPLNLLKKELKKFRPVAVKGVPRFHGGAVGYVSYDCVRYFEEIPNKNPDPHDIPDIFFVLTDALVVFNNLRHQLQMIYNVHVPKGATQKKLRKLYDKGVARLASLRSRLAAAPEANSLPKRLQGAPRRPKSSKPQMSVPKGRYLQWVKKAKDYIAAGDIIQVVVSNAFAGETDLTPFQIYRALRMLNPSPYMYYFKAKDFSIVGSSPETQVRLENGEITVRPIAGTRKRGKNDKEDAKLAQELLADPKERAEHVMLVDLGRNDAGRVAANGSVQVRDFMSVERYSHVMHLTSHVQGKIAAGRDAFDVFAATFPAGTLSGAPKIRAMEIIEELETTRRGIYGGALPGYFSFSGNMDFCIAIRTLLLQGRKFHLQAGAGIVADSKPALEFEECCNKAQAVLKAMELARQIDVGSR